MSERLEIQVKEAAVGATERGEGVCRLTCCLSDAIGGYKWRW